MFVTPSRGRHARSRHRRSPRRAQPRQGAEGIRLGRTCADAPELRASGFNVRTVGGGARAYGSIAMSAQRRAQRVFETVFAATVVFISSSSLLGMCFARTK